MCSAHETNATKKTISGISRNCHFHRTTKTNSWPRIEVYRPDLLDFSGRLGNFKITGKCSQYKNIFYTCMKIPKIQWDFFQWNTEHLASILFLCLSLRKRLITGGQNIDPQVHGPVNYF